MKAILGKLNGEWLPELARAAVPYCSQVDAAVAYIASTTHPLLTTCKEHGLKLTVYGLLDEHDAVAPSVLKELLAWGPSRAVARLIKGNFHAKVIWWRGYGAYVGSANLTEKAWFNNVEAGVFFPESELADSDIGPDLDAMFEYLGKHSLPVTDELVRKLQEFSRGRDDLVRHQRDLKVRFDREFGRLPDHRGMSGIPARGERVNRAAQFFVTEWMKTLQLMRGLRTEFSALGLRPAWVDTDAHPVVHFDQFLHAYYYSYIRDATGLDEDDDRSTIAKVDAAFQAHRANPAAALKKAALWWAALPRDCAGEEEFIRVTAPQLRRRLSREAVRTMQLDDFRAAFTDVNAFRMHARQVKNSEFGLPAGHHESIHERVTRLCTKIWSIRSPGGRTVRDVIEFVLWGDTPSDMEQRLWQATRDPAYRLPHFGPSSLGEAVGWARPDDFPPRNNRTNKALRALGHDIKLFSNG